MGVLITGGTGFIGAYVAQLFVRAGEEVVAYDINPRNDILKRLMNEEQRASIHIVTGDIRDLAHLIRVAQEHHITKIVHLAALLSTASSDNPALAVKINCEGTANVLETARILRLEKVVYASSNAVFGPAEKYDREHIPDEAAQFPSNIYGACKSLNERFAEHYSHEYHVDTVGLRFPIVYGLGQRQGAAATLTEELMLKPALGKPGRVPFGEDTLNWLYVEDAARGVIMVSGRAGTGTRVFNIGGEICPVAKAVDLVKRLVPEADISMLPGTTGFTGKYDTTKIEEEIGYHPNWKLAEGIKLVIEGIQKGDDRG